MENSALKDQQIARQVEEIESQRRKIESLEKELQRCLDPDSGELNPSIVYHTRSGETGLLDKIQTLEKQLGDCLDIPETFHFRSDIRMWDSADAFITNIGASVFMPEEARREGNIITLHRYGVWSRLVYILIERIEFTGLWRDSAFRHGLNQINEITSNHLQMARVRPGEDPMSEYRCAAEYLCMATQEDYEGMKALRAAIQRLYTINWQQADVNLETEEIDYLMFSIQIIIQCQRLHLTMWMNEKE